ncbi:MAG: FHA domain-containing protein [Pyrinomonadaceae bacterium]
MAELWLKYTDEYGDARRVSIAQEIFTVGRHPENDLCISDNRLSREHIRIEQYNDAFYVSDSNSSNGTTLNGERLSKAVILRGGDRLVLGGAVNISLESAFEEKNSYQSSAIENEYSANEESAYLADGETPDRLAASQPSVSAAPDSSSIPTAIFWLAPVFGLIVLVLVGGLFYAFSGKKEVAQTNDIYDSTPKTRTPKKDDSTDETPTPRKRESPENSNGAASSTPDDSSPPKSSGDAERIEQDAAAFLRRIAQSDPTAFLTGKQIEIVNSKIGALKGSSALADNLKAVKKNAAQFETLAATKNLKPQFLATAALAKIGNNRGDPLAVANSMLPVLSDLKITLDNKLADDNLLIIAAYERGAAGNPRSLQTTLEALSKQTQNASPRTIRTIWFLHDKGKITDAEFNFALQFIAIGAITQNPKDFNVNADAVTFN